MCPRSINIGGEMCRWSRWPQQHDVGLLSDGLKLLFITIGPRRCRARPRAAAFGLGMCGRKGRPVGALRVQLHGQKDSIASQCEQRSTALHLVGAPTTSTRNAPPVHTTRGANHISQQAHHAVGSRRLGVKGILYSDAGRDPLSQATSQQTP